LAQEVEYLPCKCEPYVSNPSTIKGQTLNPMSDVLIREKEGTLESRHRDIEVKVMG
jgi:hypothetical protein